MESLEGPPCDTEKRKPFVIIYLFSPAGGCNARSGRDPAFRTGRREGEKRFDSGIGGRIGVSFRIIDAVPGKHAPAMTAGAGQACP